MMSALDNLNPQQFYHGTAAELKPGEMVTPGHESDWYQRSSSVFATDDLSIARTYAGYAADASGRDPHVYAVEPTGTMHKDPGGGQGAVRSKHPLKVLGEER